MLKKHLDSIRFKNLNVQTQQQQKDTLLSLIDRYINGEVGKVSKATRLNYRTTKEHLIAFQKKTGYPVNFDSINLDFFYKFTAWMSKSLSNNSQAKYIRTLKVFMQGAVDMDLTENMKFKHKKFSVKVVDTDAIALTEAEIMQIYRMEMPSKKLDRVRDLFVFGCFTGLRFSDYSRVKRENIIKVDGHTMIKIVTQKTNESVIIPTNPVITEILTKYENTLSGLPKAISNQKFNEYVKEVCKLSGLTEKGRNADNLNLELWECCSSHTSRRSFCTNLYLSGFPVRDIMLISGHRNQKAFDRYIKVSKLDAAKRLVEHQKTNWSKLLLKAV
jgi:integrase